MKKNRIVTAALCTLLAASSMLGACQKTESSRGIYKPEEEGDTKPTPTEAPQLPDPTPTEAETVSEDAATEEGVSENSASENAATASAGDGAYDLTALKKMNFTEDRMAQILAFYDGAVFAGGV